ncbi:MAG TPA: MFS transporter [Phycisphaerae bacterium]|nr:MFS transporter [Phycisphaerae bacterium]HNU44181.1 MFS transporter [Phycisphaerae bacterium]
MNKERLFVGSCFGLVATAVCFAVVGAIMGVLKERFVLSNEQVGYIGGAAIWGFTVSIFILGPLCDVLGMRNLLRLAVLCHAAGALLMIFAQGYWMLFAGALILSLGNGTIEAVCNPLIATLYPDQKTQKLNKFHVWFPGGIVIGAVASFLIGQPGFTAWLDQVGFAAWRLKLGLILVPTVIYGVLFIGQKFPATERVQSGISFGGMVQGALLRPLFLILLACMCITASLELGPGRWVPAVLEAGGIAGILVLAYINGLMAVLRFFAGPVVHRLSPTGILVSSAILAGIGLYWFSFAETTVMAFASATVFALGVCYFWPTMLGVTSERVPKSGALGLGLMGGMGMLIVGLVTAPQMGHIADRFLQQQLVAQQGQTVAVLEKVAQQYPPLAEKSPFKSEVIGAVTAVQSVLATAQGGALPSNTADALRNAVKNVPPGAEPIKDEINSVLLPADNYGGRMSFRYVAPFSLVIIVVFGVIFLRDRATGGYRAERLSGAPVRGSDA